MALATQFGASLLACVFAQGEYISGKGWEATLMRHYLLASTVSALALGVRQAARIAGLIALGGSALCTDPGLGRTLSAAIALAAVAVAANEHRTAATGAYKAPGRRW